MLPPVAENAPAKRNEISLSEQAVLKLMELDIEPTLAKRLVGKAVATHMDLRKVGDVVKIAYQSYLSHPAQDSDVDGEDGDLRNANNYDDMKSAGAVNDAEW